jgi:ParB/RepB/Spo0J family partition protein
MTQNLFEIQKPKLKTVKISDIEPWFNSRLVKGRQTQSMLSLGDIEPIKLVQSLKTDYKYKVIDGKDRLDSALKAGYDTILAIVMETDDLGEAAVTLASNLNRSNNYYDEALAVEKFKQAGLSNKEIAQKLGVQVNVINSRSRFLDVQPKIRDAVAKENISYQGALDTLDLPLAEQKSLGKRLAKGETVTTRQLKDKRLVNRQETIPGLGELVLSAPTPIESFRQAALNALANGHTHGELQSLLDSIIDSTVENIPLHLS